MATDWLTPKAKNWLAPKISKTANKARVPTIKVEEQLPDLGPHTSKVESRMAKALTRRGIAWIPQVSVAGGRAIAGGSVVDFVLPQHGIYIRVQGDYWHGTTEAKAKDDLQKTLIEGEARRRGQTIRVVDIWENEIMRNADRALMNNIGVML